MTTRNFKMQILYLFLSKTSVLFIGFGLFPLLPLYASELGANRAFVGVFFAIIYTVNMAGSMVTGWLAGRISRKATFIGSAGIGIPALILLGQVTALWQLILLTGIVWFAGGAILSLINVYLSLVARDNKLDRYFNLLSLSVPIGSLLGGLTISKVLAWNGYAWMFVTLAAVWSLLLVFGLHLPKDKPITANGRSKNAPMMKKLSAKFYLVLAIGLLSATGISFGRLGTPLTMQTQQYPLEQIASLATMSGLLTIPAILLMGFISERAGSGLSLVISYILVAFGILTLNSAAHLWHYWLAATLMMLAYSANSSLLAALATKILAPSSLDRGLPWVSTSTAAASILSFGSTGFVMDAFGSTKLYSIASSLVIFASLILLALAWKRSTLSRSNHQRVSTIAHNLQKRFAKNPPPEQRSRECLACPANS